MIKLVVTDIDGTLLPEGTDRLNPELYETIRELKRRGIQFVVASGRQYMSMRYLFRPVEDEVIFIAENGSNVMCGGRNVSGVYIEPELAKELVQYLRTLPDCEIVLSVPECMYMESQNPMMRRLLENGYHNEVHCVENLIPLCEHTNKLCIYCTNGSASVADELKERFGTRLNTMIAGEKWVDFVSKAVDKGNALREVQRMLNLTPEETMAFGDNYNDLGMLSCAEESYVVANANPELRAFAKHVAPANTEDGVLRTIREIILA